MRFLSFLIGVVFMASCSWAGSQTDIERLRTFGTNNTNLIYVFTSPSCPHCANFHKEILPVLKKKYADMGLAQIKLVDMSADVRSMDVSKVARCMTDEQYEIFMEQVYQNMSDWAYQGEHFDKIKGYASKAGLDSEKQNECLNNDKLAETIAEQRNNLALMYRVSAMPTTVVVQGIKRKSFLGADKRILDQIEELLKK